MRLWKAGRGFVGAQRIQNEALAAEERNREQGILFAPRDKQLKEPISANASEKKVRADIARVTVAVLGNPYLSLPTRVIRLRG